MTDNRRDVQLEAIGQLRTWRRIASHRLGRGGDPSLSFDLFFALDAAIDLAEELVNVGREREEEAGNDAR